MNLYTMDGGEVGELEFENFNAASAKISFKGRNVHPGYAKNKMINSVSALPTVSCPCFRLTRLRSIPKVTKVSII